MPNWDDLYLFLIVARHGRFIAAGRATGLDHTTIARRIGALETTLKVRLLDRSPRGVTLTAAGLALLPYAERIEAEMQGACARLEPQGVSLTGVVRLATPEGFGTAIVAPAMTDFHRRHPDLHIELTPEPWPISLTNHEADIAIVLNRPPKGRVFARRLVDFRLGLYAAPAYLAGHAPLLARADLQGHAMVWYIDDRIGDGEHAPLSEVLPKARVAFRSSSLAAQMVAANSGLGVALLPTYIGDAEAGLVRVLGEVEMRRSYWLVFHADHQHQPRLRAVVDFIDELVEAARGRF